jgi:hypothetical protein
MHYLAIIRTNDFFHRIVRYSGRSVVLKLRPRELRGELLAAEKPPEYGRNFAFFCFSLITPKPCVLRNS